MSGLTLKRAYRSAGRTTWNPGRTDPMRIVLGTIRHAIHSVLALWAVALASDITIASPTKPLRSSCIDTSGKDSVWIPGGTFQLGTNTAYPEEAPARVAKVGGFWMDRHEVTNKQFARFVAATGYVTVAERAPNPRDYPDIPVHQLVPGSAVFSPPRSRTESASIDLTDSAQWWAFVPGASWNKPSGPGSSIRGTDALPVVHVAYEDALAYAKWVGRDLPTELEWEFAAKGNRGSAAASDSSDRLLDGHYRGNTWQGRFPTSDVAEDGFEGLAPVGCFPPNGFGLYDMLGNVWEWTSSHYRPNHRELQPATSEDPRQPGIPVRVIKGGSYLCASDFCLRYRPTARQAQDIHFSSGHIGFRTVLREASGGPRPEH